MTASETDWLRGCLSGLDRTQRYVVLMHFADDLTEMEIALVLNISARQVRSVLDDFRRRVAEQRAAAEAEAPSPRVSAWLDSAESALV